MAEKNHGPMRGNARGPRPNVANPGKLLLRLLSYIFKNYGFACIVVVICLFITVFSSVQGTLFMQTLIDDYIMWCACFLCTVQNYGICHTGNTPELKKRYVHPYGRTPDPLL